MSAFLTVSDAIQFRKKYNWESISEQCKQDIIKSVDSDDNVYKFPADMIALEHVSIKDTSDSKYKKIKRLISPPHYLLEDTSP